MVGWLSEKVNEFIQRVESEILGRGLMPAGSRVLVAVSGGVDSMVLLHLLKQLAPARGWEIIAGHYNHNLRGADSDLDANLVAKVAQDPLAMDIMDIVLPRQDIPRGLKKLYFLTYFNEDRELTEANRRAIEDTWNLLIRALR